jgi:CheY-like chemotaxis protein
LQVALINLAANARDAMPDGGTLTVRGENTVLGDGESVEGIALSLIDTGHGMSREVLARAMEPFFTTKEVGKGTGLGLAQVYGFARQSGGSMDIRSEEGRGTTVTLYLPKAQAAVADTTRPAPAPTAGARSLHILLVDDNAQVAEVAASLLAEQGHQVTSARSADEALIKLETFQGFDMVFSDLVMPGERSGLDLARIVRERWASIPVLLATGYSEAASRATQEGFTLLAKPYTPEGLLGAVSSLVARERVTSSANVVPFPRP